MILTQWSLKGALFASTFPPNDELETLAREVGTNVALFYRSFEIILAAPSLRMIWPDGVLGSNIAKFREFMEGVVAPAEKFHLNDFWNEKFSDQSFVFDVFLLKSGMIPETSLLGLGFLNFPWGRFLVVVPGEDPAEVREILLKLEDTLQDKIRQSLDRWVEDSEAEFVVTKLLERFPEEFRGHSGFLRKVGIPSPEDKTQLYNISYLFRGRKWHKEVTEGDLVAGDAEGLIWKRSENQEVDSSETPQMFRERGVRIGNEIVILFTVFLGGVLPLGDIPVPINSLVDGGLLRMKRFIREIALDMISHCQSLTSSHFRFCRYWTESGFSVKGLEEIARTIDPVNWGDLMVLPFWETGPQSLSEVKDACRVSDVFFVDPGKNMGLLLLRDCGEWQAKNVVFRHFKNRVSALVEVPVPVKWFLAGH